jgi:hypothetical protein
VRSFRSAWIKLSGAVALPVAVAAAWIPLRAQLPNTDLALVLVLVIGAVGWVAGSRPSLVAAVLAAVAFDVLDTRPYGTLTMARGVDTTTALVLLATGALIGLGAARLARLRRSEDLRSDALAVVIEASGLVATGEEKQLVSEAMGAEIRRSLALGDCTFHVAPPSGTRPMVARDGRLVGLLPGGDPSSMPIDLPVWSLGEIVAHFRLVVGSREPTQEELRVALSLADQVGAAMAGGDHGSAPEEPPRQRRLRLLPLE